METGFKVASQLRNELHASRAGYSSIEKANIAHGKRENSVKTNKYEFQKQAKKLWLLKDEVWNSLRQSFQRNDGESFSFYTYDLIPVYCTTVTTVQYRYFVFLSVPGGILISFAEGNKKDKTKTT